MGIAHRQRYLAASVSIYWGLGGSLEQHSMQISDMDLAFVESDSILDPVTPHSSMSGICKSNFRVRVRVRVGVRVRVRRSLRV